MYRAAFAVAILYAVFFALFYGPYTLIALFPIPVREVLSTYQEPFVWIYLLVFTVCQAALLLIPIQASRQRLVGRRPVIVTVLVGAFLLAVLVSGLVLLATELFRLQGSLWAILLYSVFFVSWLVWGIVFWTYSKTTSASSLHERMTRFLYRGSILEILVAIPSHIIARQRTECCAGLATFTSLTFGMSIMLISLGPGVYLLYRKRLQRLRR